MVITKREDVTKQGFCKILLLVLIQFFWLGGGRTVGAYLSLSGRGLGAYSRLGAYYLFRPLGWALIREVGAKGRTIRKPIGGRAKYKKNIRARENEMKKIRARQLTLKNIHAMG